MNIIEASEKVDDIIEAIKWTRDAFDQITLPYFKIWEQDTIIKRKWLESVRDNAQELLDALDND